MIRWDLTQGCKDGEISANQPMWYTIWKNLKNKNHTIISIDEEKAFDRIQHPSIKNSQQNGYRGNIPQHKSHIWTYIQQHTQQWKAESICFMIRNKTRMPNTAIFIRHSIASQIKATGSFASQSNHTRRRNKRNPSWKGRSKTVTVCIWHDTRNTWYIENPTDTTKKLLKLINE